ncbi:acyltransferase family protein [Duganella sp. S19_KUP01_CR8]|uniref:acyltransferase family protein n=1 Tax=Duganella sp. S19_KUP01_CR8 TaxID=3025502 RepID=UPI002FCDD151
MKGQRFLFLDGMRGLAALFVLVRHTRMFWDFSFYRSYLAVDLFFLLSGFVIAHAYDAKLQSRTLSVPRFMEVRMIRLYPVFLMSLVLAAVVMGAKLFIKQPGGLPEALQLMALVAATALFLPLRLADNPGLFPLNGPYWSLFFEVLVNWLYALIRPVLSSRVLSAVVLAAFLLLAGEAAWRGSFDLGFSWSAESWVVGSARSVFGIFAGLWLHRHGAALAARWRVSPWLALGAVALMLGAPDLGGLNGVVDLLALALVFPACVLVAARGQGGRGATVLAMLGAASYPMYVLHQPLAQVLSHPLAHLPKPFGGLVFLALLLGVSAFIELRVDTPVRRWLSGRRSRAGLAAR